MNTEQISKMNLLGDTVLVKLLPEDMQTKSGLYLPEGATTQQKTGIRGMIYSVGKKFRHKDEAGIGHTVIVSKYLGTILDKTDESLRIFDGEDILGIVESHG